MMYTFYEYLLWYGTDWAGAIVQGVVDNSCRPAICMLDTDIHLLY